MRRVGHVQLGVREAKAFAENHFAIAGDEHRAVETLLLHKRVQIFIKLRSKVLRGGARGEKQQERNRDGPLMSPDSGCIRRIHGCLSRFELMIEA